MIVLLIIHNVNNNKNEFEVYNFYWIHFPPIGMGNIKSLDIDNEKTGSSQSVDPIIIICGYEKSGKSTLLKEFDNFYGHGIELEEYKNDVYFNIIRTVKEVNREIFKNRLSVETTVSYSHSLNFTEKYKNG